MPNKINRLHTVLFSFQAEEKLNILELVVALQSCLILESSHRLSVIRLESEFQKTLFILIFIRKQVGDLTGCNIKVLSNRLNRNQKLLEGSS